MFTMLKMLKNSDRNWTLTQFASGFALAMGVSFTRRDVEVVEGWAAEGVSSQSAEASLVGAGSACDVDGDGEEGGVVVTASEVVFTAGARGRESRVWRSGRADPSWLSLRRSAGCRSRR